MSRYLFVVPPLVGHINPTVSVGAELVRRGHTVAWAGHQGTSAPLLPRDAVVFPALPDAAAASIAAARTEWLGLRGIGVFKFFWESFLIPLGHAMLPGVASAVESFRPDVVVADQQALAGPVAASAAGVPWVTSASTPGELLDPLRDLPKVSSWVSDKLTSFAGFDARFSPALVLVFSSRLLVPGSFPEHYVFIGPALGDRPCETPFPWDWLDSRRRVLVSLGTLNGAAGGRFFSSVVEAVTSLDVQVVLVSPVPVSAPQHVLVVDRVPQLSLMPHLDAVVTHGGHNTVCEALAHGLPLVVAPIRDDQPLIASSVTDCGAGIRLRYQRVRAPEIRDALERVLKDPSYAAAAGRVRDSFAAAGGAPTAADHLEAVVA
ncbi:glycosyl transferase [Lentzea sp. NBRC 105346]|uniref:glycosyltransferase n=1 Tax=Lentzea sp. NBRC 105346 TaxID=3032205 RepID=UPI0024A395B1|nr:glycosyltransferase [Lentzea sp. NBRC 105346]GLZ28413.1 glycosyl transferase [Lentzea sp. NBRC 105346]